ncbi:hypothetical protein B0H13DRAFT_1860496 [Mycena leptocephala]|nr:hypothetical protein B0H13DRAFT_1860496 [Mycena leptocephala]
MFGNPAREKILFPLVKRICSSVRNSFRQHEVPVILETIKHICGDSPATLANFTDTSAMKFKRGSPGISLDVGYMSDFKFKRRFARENLTVIGVEEVEDEDDDSFENSRSSLAPPTKKRKLNTQTQGGGRIPKGKDFWSQVDTFIAKKITEFGTKNLQNAGWKEYTKDTIRMDEIHFPVLPDLEMDAELSKTNHPFFSSPTPTFWHGKIPAENFRSRILWLLSRIHKTSRYFGTLELGLLLSCSSSVYFDGPGRAVQDRCGFEEEYETWDSGQWALHCPSGTPGCTAPGCCGPGVAAWSRNLPFPLHSSLRRGTAASGYCTAHLGPWGVLRSSWTWCGCMVPSRVL